MIEHVFLDLDGVLVNFVQGSLDVHNLKITVEELYKDHPGVWDFVKILGMSPAAFWKGMGEEFWAKLDWMPDGKEIFKAVIDKFGEENITILTSPSSNYECHAGKIRWMERHLPRRFSKPSGHFFGSEKYRLARPSHLLIDDNNDNIDKFAANGGKTFLVPRIWNRAYVVESQALSKLESFLKSQATVKNPI